MPNYPIPHFTQTDRKERLLAACHQLETVFRNHATARHIPGVAYGVILDGELIFDQGFGVREALRLDADPPQESQEDVTTETVFRIASMTKSFAAVAILQLRDAGHLRLDEPAATYVPELSALTYPTADSAPVTVRQLLSMDSGWPQDDPWADRQLYQTDAALSDFYRDGVSWSNPPGVTFEYSNYGYMVLGRIITNVAGMPAIDYISQRILQPLGMTDTVWHDSDVPDARLALGHRWEDEQWKPEELLPTGGDVAAFAGLFTTVQDLTRWVGLFLSAWPPSDPYSDENSASTILSRSSLREMQRIWTAGEPSIEQSALGAIPSLSAGGYGFGLSLQHNGRWLRVGHGGGLPGFGSYMCWVPEIGVGVVGLSNVTYGAMSMACIEALNVLLDESGLAPRTLPIAPALAVAQDQLIKLIAHWDDDIADALFADNFLLDKDKAHWLETFTELQEKHGALTLDEAYSNGAPIRPQNWLRGEWRMAGEQGWCDFFISLSPTVPPRIQTLKIDSTLPPSADLQTAMKRLAALITRPTKREFKRLCAAVITQDTATQETLWDQIRMANILCGDCAIGEVIGGDGTTWVEFEMDGRKGSVNVQLEVNDQQKFICQFRNK